MSWEEVCDVINATIEQYFESGLTDFFPSVVMDICNEVEAELDANDLSIYVAALAENDLIDEDFQFSLISRNNFEILSDYWEQIETMRLEGININYQITFPLYQLFRVFREHFPYYLNP